MDNGATGMNFDFTAAWLQSSNASPPSSVSPTEAADGSPQSASSSNNPKPTVAKPRVSRACDTCRKRKTRCSGLSATAPPGSACPECVSASRTCVWAPPKRSTGPKSYAESLEQRCEALEGVLRGLSLANGVDLAGVLDSFEGEEKVEALERAREVVEEGLREKELQGKGVLKSEKDLEDAFNAEEMTIEKNRFVGASSGPFWSRNVIRRLIEPNPLPWDPTLSPVDVMLRAEHEKGLPNLELPPPDLAAALIGAYFTHVNLLLPILHGPSFCRAIEAGMMDSDPTFRSLAFMVFALGSRFVKDERIPMPMANLQRIPKYNLPVNLTCGRGFLYFNLAQKAITTSTAPSTLFDIQCSVLGILYILGSSTPVVAWNLVGWSIRRAVDVGAHCEGRVRWGSSRLEDQLRKRSFHILLATDRNISVSLGRPLSIQDHELDLSYPIDITDEQLDEWNLAGPDTPPPAGTGKNPSALSGMLCMLKLQDLTAKAQRSLYGLGKKSTGEVGDAKVSEFDSELNAWLGSIPEHLKWDSRMPKEWLPISAQVYCAYYNCQIVVHRERLVPKPQFINTLPSLAICSNAARSTAHVLDVLMQNSMLEDAFWYAPLYAAGAALVLMINTISTPARTSSFKDVERCIAVTETMAADTFMAWRVGSHMSKMLAVVSARTSGMVSSPPPLTTPPGPICSLTTQSMPPAPIMPPAPLVTNGSSYGNGFQAPYVPSPTSIDATMDLLLPDMDFSYLSGPTPASSGIASEGTDWLEAFGGGFDFEAWAKSLAPNSLVR